MTTARTSGPATSPATKGIVALHWALFAKDPGQRDDYGVVRASNGQVLPETMDAMIRHYSPGVPVGENTGAPDTLPWVTFTSAAVNRTPYVGVAIVRWPADPVTEVDATGRTIVSTLFFCLPEATFTRELGSHLALYDTVREITPTQLRDEPRRPLELPATRRERITLFPEARDTRFDTALAAAALLLDRPVTVTLAQAMGVRARITFLDQVAALLPAGITGAMSAATWTDVRTHHGIRLGFGQDLDGGRAARLDPNRPPSLAALTHPAAVKEPGRSSASARYAALLAHLLGLNAPGGLSADRLAGLVHQLATEITPGTFTRPDALADLVAAKAALSLISAVHEGAADLGEIRRYLRAMPAGADPQGRLLGLLAAAPQPADFALLAQHWPMPAGGAGPARLARDLAFTTYSDDDLAPVVTGSGEVAAAIARVLLEPAPATGVASGEAVNLAIDLVIGRRATAGSTWAPIHARLASEPPLAVHAVLRCLDKRKAAEHLKDLVTWVDPHGDQQVSPVLRPYRKFLQTSRDHPLEDADIAVLAQLGPDLGDRALRGLFQLAIRRGQVKDAQPAISSWLADEQQGTFGARRQADWQTVIETMTDERERARMLAIIGGGPARRGLVGRILGKDGARPAGPTRLPVRWLAASRASPAEDRGMAALVERRSPTPSSSSATGQPHVELAFVGNGDGKVAAIAVVPAATRPGDQESPPYRYSWSADYADFVAGGGRIHEFCLGAYEAATSGQQPDHFTLEGPTTVPGPAGDPATVLAGLVDTYGFPIIAAVAARLLTGPVTVVADPGAPPPLEQRLGFLAAVLALLPAGASSALSVVTWTDRPGQFRIAFSDRRAVDGDRGLPWPVPLLSTSGSLTGSYANRLRWTRATRADTLDIVRGLAALTDPVDLDDVASRLEVVGRNPLFGWQSSGRRKDLAAARSRARVMLTGQPVNADELRQATATLLADGEIADLELADRLARRLASGHAVAPLLVGLLRTGGSGGSGEQHARVHQGTAKLILDHQDALTAEVRDALRGAPAVAIALMAQADGYGTVSAWLRWLGEDGGLPPELAPFGAASAGRQPTEAQLRQVAEFGPDGPAMLHRLAMSHRAPAAQTADSPRDTGWHDAEAAR